MSRAITAAVLLLAFSTTGPAFADTLQITDGRFGLSNVTDFDLRGAVTGANVSLSFADVPYSGLARGGIEPGTPVNISGAAIIGGFSSGLTVDGTRYVITLGTLNFLTNSVVFVPTPGVQFSSFTTPFTMSGPLQATIPPVPENPIASFTLQGQGTASFTIQDFGPGGGFFMSALGFTLEPPNGTAPIPEPTSLLLVTSGLAGLGLWRRRSRHT